MAALTVHGSEMLTRPRSFIKGFTLIELMVVMTIIALLLSLAVPRYFHSLDKAREATLRQDLDTMRDAIDKFHGDNGHYPISLEELVARKYLRAIPPDPITGDVSAWVVVSPDAASEIGVYDVKSSAQGIAADGSRYGDW
jgi:general secretion pathway protein G